MKVHSHNLFKIFYDLMFCTSIKPKNKSLPYEKTYEFPYTKLSYKFKNKGQQKVCKQFCGFIQHQSFALILVSVPGGQGNGLAVFLGQ